MLRQLKEQDTPAIQRLNAESLGYDFPLERTREQFDRLSQSGEHFFLGWEDDETGDLVAYCHAQIYESLYSETGVNILALAVLESYQRQGIGRQLLSALEDLARDKGLAFIRLNSGSQRLAAHAFYQSCGYDGNKLQIRFIKDLS